jgi:hypothetical protein
MTAKHEQEAVFAARGPNQGGHMTATHDITAPRDNGALLAKLIAKGDLDKMSEDERTQYYLEVCLLLGLAPLTQPFAYIRLNNKLTLYALRNATDQLRGIHNVSVEDMSATERDGVHIVTVKVRNGNGRTDMATGAVTLGNLRGDALANALMKCETKAKRRATLSICGVGMLDETEIETIPTERKSSYRSRKDGDWDFVAEIKAITTVDALIAWRENNRPRIDKFPPQWLAYFKDEVYDPRMAELKVNDQPLDTPEVPNAKPLSEIDSTALLKTLTIIIGKTESRALLMDWVNDPQTQIEISTLVEADKTWLRDAYAFKRDSLPIANILDAG